MKLPMDALSLRRRAMMCRHLADGMKDKHRDREQLTLMAHDYEKLADVTERARIASNVPRCRRTLRAAR